MKFNVSSKTLYTAASAVSKVISSKNRIAILNNFLFEVTKDSLLVTASDLENTLTTKVAIQDVEGTGSFCIDARRVVDLLKELPDMGIKFNVDDSTLAIEIDYPGGVFNFTGSNGNEYPQTKEDNTEGTRYEFDVPSDMILKGIDNTLFAIGTDDVRPQMKGILWDIMNDGITFVATDTRKLVKYQNTMAAPGQTCSCIMPLKPSTIIKNVFGKDEVVHVMIEPKSATLSTENFVFNCRFIKGNFPDYNRVIPTTTPYVLTIDRVSLLNAVKRVGVFVDPGHGLIKFKITPSEITMKAQDNNFNTSARETIPCDFTGNEMVIGFSAPYLIEIVGTITTNNLIVKLIDPSRPGVFVPDENEKDSELMMLLMPMTVQDF